MDKDKQKAALKAEVDLLNKQKELADFQAFVEKQERIAGQGNDMDYVDGCNFTIGLIRKYIHEKKKIEHISPLCKVLDEAKYVFGDDKNIDIDEICQYIRNAYIAESEVEE